MSTISGLLGTSQFAGNCRLEFHAKNERTAVKLYQADKKLGTFYLEKFPEIMRSPIPLSYENLPQLARSKIDQFLTLHEIKISPERVSIAPPKTSATSIAPSLFQVSASVRPPLQNPLLSTQPPAHTPETQGTEQMAYVASVKGPFIGSFPTFINSKFVLASSFGGYCGMVRVYDLEKNEFICDMPSRNVSLQETPLYENNGKMEVITGWDFQRIKFTTNPNASVVNNRPSKTFTPEGTLIITTSNGVYELKNAVSCGFEISDDFYNYDDYKEELVCYDTIVMGQEKIGVLQNGQLHIWDLRSHSCIHSFSQEEVRKHRLAYCDCDDDRWTCNFSFQGDSLVRSGHIGPEILQFTFTPFTIKKHQLGDGEIFKGIFNEKILTIHNQNLYFRDLGSNEPRALFMPLGFDVKTSYKHKDFLLLVTNNDESFLIDIKNRRKTQLVSPEEKIKFTHRNEIRFIDNCLFLIEDNSEFKTFGFKLHTFDFSNNRTNLYADSASQTNISAEYKKKDLESRLTSFLSKRVGTVGWDSSNTLAFIKDLKDNFPKESVKQKIIKIICDSNHFTNCISPSGLIPCFATYILKKLNAISSEDVPLILPKSLEALEDAYQIYCPSDDVALHHHHSDIRREALAAFAEMGKVSANKDLTGIVSFLTSAYRKIDQGHGLKRELRSHGEIWGMKNAIISVLNEVAKKASQEDLKLIHEVLSSFNKQ